MDSALQTAEARLRRSLPNAPDRLFHNLLYLAQGYALHRLSLPLFVNGIAPVADGVRIDPVAQVSHAEECASAIELAAVVDEVLVAFAGRSDEAVAKAVIGTEAWQEASAGGWCLAPEVIRDEFARGLPPIDRPG